MSILTVYRIVLFINNYNNENKHFVRNKFYEQKQTFIAVIWISIKQLNMKYEDPQILKHVCGNCAYML